MDIDAGVLVEVSKYIDETYVADNYQSVSSPFCVVSSESWRKFDKKCQKTPCMALRLVKIIEFGTIETAYSTTN